MLNSQKIAQTVQRILEDAGPIITRRIALWLLLTTDNDDLGENKVIISDDRLIRLSEMVERSELSATAAKDVFFEMQKSQDRPDEIAKRKNLTQLSDDTIINDIIKQVLNDKSNLKALEDIKNGNDKAIGFLVGQVMKVSLGRANPAKVQNLIRQQIEAIK